MQCKGQEKLALALVGARLMQLSEVSFAYFRHNCELRIHDGRDLIRHPLAKQEAGAAFVVPVTQRSRFFVHLYRYLWSSRIASRKSRMAVWSAPLYWAFGGVRRDPNENSWRGSFKQELTSGRRLTRSKTDQKEGQKKQCKRENISGYHSTYNRWP